MGIGVWMICVGGTGLPVIVSWILKTVFGQNRIAKTFWIWQIVLGLINRIKSRKTTTEDEV